MAAFSCLSLAPQQRRVKRKKYKARESINHKQLRDHVTGSFVLRARAKKPGFWHLNRFCYWVLSQGEGKELKE